MVSSKASSVRAYLAELPRERRALLEAVIRVIRKHLPRGFEEGMQYGMVGYYVPLKRYPDTYNGQPLAVAALASQKGYMSLYLMCVYATPELGRWFEKEYAKTGKKLDMGKSCLRFKSLDDLPLDLIGKVIARTSVDEFIAIYEKARRSARSARKTKTSRAKARA